MPNANENTTEAVSPQSEQRATGVPPPGAAPRKHYVALALVAVAALAMLGYGIRSRMTARANLRTETAQMARLSVSVVTPERTEANGRNYSSRERRALHHLADLRPHQRLLKEVVCRHWRARKKRGTAGGHRNSGSRSTA